MEELIYYWSDDGRTVVVIDDDGNEEQLTREEFLEMGVADEPYKEEDQTVALEEYYGKYFDNPDYYASDSQQPRRPTRPIRESIYDSNRWRGLKKVENFLRIEDRMILLENLKKDFRLADVEKGYYSLLLELTYLAGDLAWAKSAQANRDDQVESVVEMLHSYRLDGIGIELQEIKVQERLRQAFDELNEWHQLIGEPVLREISKEKQINLLAEAKNRERIRRKIKKELTKINSNGLKPIQTLVKF